MATWDPGTFNPHDPAYLADPYPTYASFRQYAPVARVQPYKRYWVFNYGDVVEMLQTNQKNFLKCSPLPPAGPPPPFFHMAGNLPPGLFSMDPPLHNQLRGIVQPMFDTAIQHAGTVATTLAKPLIETMKESRRVELISSFAIPLPAQVLFSVLGLPQADWPVLIGIVTSIVLGHDVTASMGAQMAAGTSDMALMAYYQGYVKQCQSSPQPGLVGTLVSAAPGAGDSAYSPDFIESCCTDLTVAGYLSTTLLIGTGMLNLLNNPDQLALLRREPGRMEDAVEEMLRFDAPAQIVDRYVQQDTTLPSSMTLKRGDAVSGILGSANHDPTAFTNPDVFDITAARTKPHLSFGDGMHICIGAPLARRVAPAAFSALLAALPMLELDGVPQWQTDPYLRGLNSLPLRIG